MGIELWHNEGTGGVGPRIRCDGCGEYITDGMGNVEWKDGDGHKPVAGTQRFVHKRCPDGRERHNTPDPWMELDLYLIRVLLNTRIDIDQAQGHQQQSEEFRFA